ncbi:TIGR03118 family protein [Angustibacter sp. McL0619]|uniref:TIGR03118 family protein n=1 Tax=Angustibacter sp. McL0619 TaxID=3415676 RepID=UPI003CF9F62E
MSTTLRRPSVWLAVGTAVCAVSALAAGTANAEAVGPTRYTQVNLVSDVRGAAQVTDPNLVNPWGASYLGTSPLWVSDNGKDVTTLYAGGVHGTPQTINSLVVSLPGGKPTGQVSNPTTSFLVRDDAGISAPAKFLFVGESGHLSGWAPTVGGGGTVPSTHAVDAVVTPGAVYKGLAMGADPGGPLLYAADFSAGTVDVYNGLFQRVITTGNFQDPKLPAHFAPFNVMVSGDQVYVAYAQQDAAREDEVAGTGRGRVDVFTLQGDLVRRLPAHRTLNAPWGMTIAPAGFGTFSGDLLVGNFGNGRIHAYDRNSLVFQGIVRGAHGTPIKIDGLWALLPGNGMEAGTDQVLFTAGPQDESHGLLGTLSVAH